tara:strand:+ start:1193 stop:2035 length:843 start_codon:yes stop_codon:yes gene_type:complete
MIIDGKKEAEIIRNKIKKEIFDIKSKISKTPSLSVILIGDFAPSKIYVKNKEKRAREVGINSQIIRYPKNISEKEVLVKIDELNNDKNTTGILVQLPLPEQISKEKIINAIHPSKDVDGFNPVNVGNLSSGYNSIVPCTPLACLLLIKKIEKDLSGKHAVIIGRSNLNGKPMAQLLLKENCTVTIVHSRTKNLQNECLKADILVAAAGVPNLVKKDWVKENAIIIDVGINKIGEKIVGDVNFDELIDKVKAITPVPGGVGPMTIACLLKNTLECFRDHQL